MLREWSVECAVLKPRVSATAFGTHLVSAGQALSDEDWRPLEASGCLVQAFVPEIETQGEISLVYLDGAFSHAVSQAARGRRLPGSDGFRRQPGAS